MPHCMRTAPARQSRRCARFRCWPARATPLAFATVEQGVHASLLVRTAIHPAAPEARDRDFARLIDEFESGSESGGISAELATRWRARTGCESWTCLLYTSPSPRDGLLSRMPSSA